MDWLNDKFDLVVNSITNLVSPSSSSKNPAPDQGQGPNNLTGTISQVVDVTKFTDQISLMPIKNRAFSLILYGEGGLKKEPSKIFSKYNIIVHIPAGKSYLLFHTVDLTSAEQLFAVFSRSIPYIVDANPSICSQDNLQKFCAQLEVKPFWGCTHLVAYFNLYDLFHHSHFVSKLNDQHAESNETPIMIAIRQNNINCVQALIDFNVQVDLNDSKNNTVLHFACKYSPVSLKMLLERYPEMRSLINELNDDGESCLYLTKEAKHVDSLNLLLKNGANPNLIFKVE